MEREVKIINGERTIVGDLYLPEGAGKCPMVIVSHGYNGSGYDFKMMAQELNKHGIGAYCYDFCGGSVNARSSMSTKEMTLFTEEEDLNAVVDEIKKLDTTDAAHLYLFGASQGGLISALVADSRPEDIKALVLLYPALCIADNWRENFPKVEDIPDELDLWGMVLGRIFFESIRDFDVFEHIGTFPKKVLLMHGDRDEIVASAYSERAYAKYPDGELEVFTGEGHGFSEEGNVKMTSRVIDFIKKTR